MQSVFYDHDGDLETLRNVKVGVIGYGIQGRAQSLNLRDSGIDVLVGNRSDSYSETAASDGFQVQSIRAVASAADVLLLLIPDQAHGDIYRSHIEPNLRNGGGRMRTGWHGSSAYPGGGPVPRFQRSHLATHSRRRPDQQAHRGPHGKPARRDSRRRPPTTLRGP